MTLETPNALVRLASMAAVGGTSIFLLRRWPTSGAILLLTFCPLWLLLGSTYDEYSPFALPAFALMLAWAFLGNMATAPWWAVGAAVAGLTLMYLGFAPLALMFWAYYATHNWRHGALAAITGLLVTAVGIEITWGSIPGYLSAVAGGMNLGRENTLYGPYQGQEQPGSIYFRPGYVFSWRHARELAFMFC